MSSIVLKTIASFDPQFEVERARLDESPFNGTSAARMKRSNAIVLRNGFRKMEVDREGRQYVVIPKG